VQRFSATARSLRSHRVPDWFSDAKLGIFVHWGLFSVPAWAPRGGSVPDLVREHFDTLCVRAPYAEWYWNAIREPGTPSARHHREVWRDAPYQEFQAPFEAMLERWDPAPWAELFAEAGARYVVLVTKHHDGYLLWPSRHANPRRPGWQSKRDVVGELAAAVRGRGMRFGVYYSGGLDWTFREAPIRNAGEMLASVPREPGYARYVDAHYRELIERVEPSVLWNDIAYPPPADALWRLLSDYYHAVPEGVVNDRFQVAGALHRALRFAPARRAFNAAVRRLLLRPGQTFAPPPPPVHDFRTPEYARFHRLRRRKWEATRGIGHSFGHCRNEDESEMLDPGALVRMLVDVVARNGNLLLNLGPDARGLVPEAQAGRVRALGHWLARNGAAIHDTRPWGSGELEGPQGLRLRLTAATDTLYVLLLDEPHPGPIRLPGIAPRPGAAVRLLGHGALAWRLDGGSAVVEWPRGLAPAPAHALALDDPALAASKRLS